MRKGHKRHRRGPTCPQGGFHRIGRAAIYCWIAAYPVYRRTCVKCGTHWTRYPDEVHVLPGGKASPLHFTRAEVYTP